MTFRCKTTTTRGNIQYNQVGLRLFYPNCSKLNTLCSAKRGAYVPAITVCLQTLYTPLPVTADYVTPYGGLALSGSAGVSSSHYETSSNGSFTVGGTVAPVVNNHAAFGSGGFIIGGTGVILLTFPVAFAGNMAFSGGTTENVGYTYIGSGSFGNMGGAM